MNSNLDGFVHFTHSNGYLIFFSKKNLQGISLAYNGSSQLSIVINYYKGSDIRFDNLYESTAKDILKRIYKELLQ